MTLAEYESTRPKGEKKVETENFVIRINQEGGTVKVAINRKSKDGFEQLPLGYILGSNYAICKGQ